MAQRFFMKVALNCNACNVAGILDQLQVGRVGMTDLTIVDGESAEDFTFTRKQGARPNGANTIRQKEVTIVVPNGLPEDVSNVDRLPPINSGAAGTAFRANRHGPYICSK